MKLIVRYISRHTLLFLAGIAFLSLEAMADLLQPAFMANIVDEGVKQADLGQILRYGTIMLGIALLGAVGAVMRNFFASYTSRLIGKEMRSDLYRKVQTLSFENIDRLQPASIITRITNDVTQIQDFINGCMRIMFKAPITCIGAILLIMIQVPSQIPIMVIILAVCAFLILCNMRLGYPRFGIRQTRLDRLNMVSREFLASIRVVKAFGAETHESEKFDRASGDLSEAGIAAMRVMAVFSPLINLTVNLGTVVLLWRAQYRDAAQIGRLMASVNYMTQILFAVGMVSNILNTAVRAAASAERVREILEEVPVQQETGSKVRGEAAEQEPGEARRESEYYGQVEFRKVSFCYAGAGMESLKDINFRACPGETIGIIGPTGSGKSTLVNLIPRFYDATAGQVLIDGRDVTRMDSVSLRRAVAVVPQKALLFTGTIAENLRWGRQDASPEELRQAAETACADDFVDSMKDGYETLLGQGGVNLSGGQKQRLALARALLRDPKILILDDCTSALDAATEAKVLEGIRKQSQGVTVFLISQRISTVMRADQILCLEEGQIQGLGTHEDLMKTCATYQNIYHSQIGGGAL